MCICLCYNTKTHVKLLIAFKLLNWNQSCSNQQPSSLEQRDSYLHALNTKHRPQTTNALLLFNSMVCLVCFQVNVPTTQTKIKRTKTNYKSPNVAPLSASSVSTLANDSWVIVKRMLTNVFTISITMGTLVSPLHLLRVG